MQIRIYEDGDEPSVVTLWREDQPEAAPHNEPALVIRKKLAVERDLFFVATLNSAIVGTVMGGYDGHRGWVYALVVNPAYRRQGIGIALVRHLEAALGERGSLKVNLQVRASNEGVVAFYRKLGYVVEERISLGKRLY
jgi:ribosomal protein S18 acetylase RimI-like enzyme